MDISRKRWDHKLGAFVLDTSAAKEPYWDAKTGKWESGEKTAQKEQKEQKEQTVEISSCEVPTKHLGPGTPSNTYYGANNHNYHSNYNANNYRTVYPWEGISRLRWPYTWQTLVQMYFASDWHLNGKYIDVRDWEARLRGEYKPEPKYPRSYYDYDGG